MTIPLLGERFLSDQWHLFVFAYHYAGTVSPVVAMTAADGLFNIIRVLRKEEWCHKYCVWIGSVILILNLALIPKFPLWDLSHLSFYKLTEIDKSGYKALQVIPNAVSLSAQNSIGPHLCNREAPVYLLKKGVEDSDYIIASKELGYWPFDNYGQIENYLDEKIHAGYKKVFEENGWVVLKREN